MSKDDSHVTRPRLRVFLSGRIDGVAPAEASGWRQTAAVRLSKAGFTVYDPTQVMRARADYRPAPNEVFINDRWNLARSDIVLVNLELPPTIPSREAPFFTIGEMFLAHEAGLPVIVFGSCFEGRSGHDAIVTRSFPRMDEAVEYVIEAYGKAWETPASTSGAPVSVTAKENQ